MKKNSILTICLYIVGIVLVCAIVIKLMPFIFVGGLVGLWYNTKKKPNPKWRNYSIVAIIIGLVGSALFLPPTQKETSTPPSTKITSSTTTTTKKTKAEQQKFATKPSVDKKIVEAEKAFDLLEQNPSREQYALAAAALSKVTDSQKKAEFQTRLEAAEQKLIAQEAEKAVKYLEDNQHRNNVDPAKEKLNKVTDEALHTKLTQRISAVVNAIDAKEAQAAAAAEQERIAQEAEKAVKYLEDNQYRNNVDAANVKTNKVADETLRGNLTERVNAVVAAIETREAQAAQQAAAAQEERIVYVTGKGKSPVYWYSTANMPSNTNRANIITMSEAEAIRLGKRHSQKD